ncbi:MAG: response regulator transcription factor [Bacteroidota bacterium]
MRDPLTLVIADDHPLFRNGLRELIESDSTLSIVGEADNGASAFALIRQYSPMMVILDIHMPGGGGLDVARQIRDQRLSTDVLFLTMYNDEDAFNEAMDLGARGYILKDSAVHEVLVAVHTVADGRFYVSPQVSDHLIKRSSRLQRLLQYAPSLEDLTPAELRILRLIAECKTSKEIAEHLSISYKTVENHRTNIASKLRLRGSHSLVKFALDNRSALTKK